MFDDLDEDDEPVVYVLTDDEEQKVEEGTAAQALLENPMFLLAIERVRKDCSEGILTSPPEASAQRERLYNLSRGLSAVTAELAMLASEAETVLQNARRSTEEAPVQDDPDSGSDY